MRGQFLRGVLSGVLTFVLFFLTVSFVITCSFLMFFAIVDLPEEDVRAFAPLVFGNTFVLAAVFWLFDWIRRRYMVRRPAERIMETLRELKRGNFDARVPDVKSVNLETRFKDISEHINLLAEELAGVETLRTDFIANVSHELKTPMAVMQNYGMMLQRPGLSEEERTEYAGAIVATSRRLADLVTNILKLNKLENQQIFPMVKEYDLSEQLCECLLTFEDEWERKGIHIETNIEENVRVASDAELLSLVWNNLISNAMKFTDEGGTVSVGVRRIGQWVETVISDTGCGMDTEVGKHIFEKFYQGDTSHSTQGNGLGLALVKRIIDIVEGEIVVHSVPGEGSTFAVRIRRADNEGLARAI